MIEEVAQAILEIIQVVYDIITLGKRRKDD